MRLPWDSSRFFWLLAGRATDCRCAGGILVVSANIDSLGDLQLAWGLMVGMLDNVVKPLLISRGGSTPMILVMLGVFGGAIAFGVIGMFLGPTLVALGYNLLEQWSEIDGGKNPAAISLKKTDL